MMMRFICTSIILSTISLAATKSVHNANSHAGKHGGKVVVCTTTVAPDSSNYRFDVEDTDLNLCTHLICINSIWDKTITLWNTADKKTEESYKQFTNLRKKYPHLRVSLALKYLLSAYSEIAADPERRQTFTEEATNFILHHKFDGLDLIWDFSNLNENQKFFDEASVENIQDLALELKESFKSHRLLLTSSFISEDTTFADALDIGGLSTYLDYLHFIPKYDYIPTWPGSRRVEDVLKLRSIANLDNSIDHLINLGVTSDKIIVGLHFSGLTFHSIFDVPSKYATLRKTIEYNEVCQLLSDNAIDEWDNVYDEEYGLEIASFKSISYGIIRRTEIVVFESGRSIANKIMLVTRRKLAGVMAYTIDMDDLQGVCGIEENAFSDFNQGNILNIHIRHNTSQPLLKIINYALRIASFEETQARTSNKQIRHASDGISNFHPDADYISKIPELYRPLVPLIYSVNDAIVVAYDKMTGAARRNRANQDKIIQMPTINTFSIATTLRSVAYRLTSAAFTKFFEFFDFE